MNKIMSEYIKSRSLRLGRNRVAQRGIALIMTLLILSMVIMLSLGMVIALSSQTFIGGYYRNFRGSFYAADSGLNVARQALANQLTSSVPGTFATPPIANPTAVASTVLSTMLGNYGSSEYPNVGTAANSWSESFKITNASFSLAIGPTITATDSNAADCSPQPAPCPTAYSYTYAYSLTSVGSAQGTEKTTVTENGDIILNISGASANSSVSFAYFGGFVDKYPACLGPLVPGTMTGPMFTNDAWEFMPSMAPWTSPYIFTDPVGQHDSSAYYWDTGWGCHSSATTSYGSGANLVAPTFEAGFNMNQPKVPLPTNSFSQEWAVLDGRGTGEGSLRPTAAQLNTTLSDIHGAAYPTSGASSGVFIPSVNNPSTCSPTASPCVKGGGFLIPGNAQILLKPSGTSAQVYQITQGQHRYHHHGRSGGEYHRHYVRYHHAHAQRRARKPNTRPTFDDALCDWIGDRPDRPRRRAGRDSRQLHDHDHRRAATSPRPATCFTRPNLSPTRRIRSSPDPARRAASAYRWTA